MTELAMAFSGRWSDAREVTCWLTVLTIDKFQKNSEWLSVLFHMMRKIYFTEFSYVNQLRTQSRDLEKSTISSKRKCVILISRLQIGLLAHAKLTSINCVTRSGRFTGSGTTTLAPQTSTALLDSDVRLQ